MVNFYFDKSSILQYIRQERMTKVDYISQMGGLLGPEKIAERGPRHMFLVSNFLYEITIRNRDIQKEPYKRTKAKEPRLQQQQHKSRFLEASIVRQANGKLSNKKVVKNLMIC